MHSACEIAGLKPLIGCRLDLGDAPSLLAYPCHRDGYGRLSRLLSLGKMRAQKGACELSLQDVAEHAAGIAFIAWPEEDIDAFEVVRAGFIAATTMRGSSGSTGSRASTAAPSSPPTTSIIMHPTAGRCRTSSPAFARK
jgi:hypothetical protein